MDDPLVCVVDDDDAVRLSMSLLIETLGLPVQSFASALDVLADAEVRVDRVRARMLSGLSGDEQDALVAGLAACATALSD